jgi:hypothetical protein
MFATATALPATCSAVTLASRSVTFAIPAAVA